MIKNLTFDEKSGVVNWEYQEKNYQLNVENLLNAKGFEKEERILILCGNYSAETHLYAYDFYGNFLFEVMPPSEKYQIVKTTNYPQDRQGKSSAMSMFCLSEHNTDDCFDSAYCIDPNTGELTFAGRIKY